MAKTAYNKTNYLGTSISSLSKTFFLKNDT